MAGTNWLIDNPDYGLVSDDMVLPAKPGGISGGLSGGLSDAVKSMYTPMPMMVSAPSASGWDPSVETAVPVSMMGSDYGGVASGVSSAPSVVPSVRDASVVPAGGASVSKASWSDFSSPDSFDWNSQTMQSGLSAFAAFQGLNERADLAGANAQQFASQADAIRFAGTANYRAAGINMMRMRSEQERYMGRQAASVAQSGFAGSSGSVKAVESDTMSVFERQISDMTYKADVQKQQSDYQAKVMDWRASESRKQQKKAKNGAIGSLIGSAVGAFVGGPVGMSVGSKIGGSLFSF